MSADYESPVRTRLEVVPGDYGVLSVYKHGYHAPLPPAVPGSIWVRLGTLGAWVSVSADDCRQLSTAFGEIAEALGQDA